MNVAITIWENRVSPVFDSSHMLLIAEIENARIKNRTHVTFNPEMPSYLVENLNRMGVTVFICGAVSEMPAHMIDMGGIELIPFVAGPTEKVLASFVKDNDIHPEFFMPGCDRKPRRRGYAHSNQLNDPNGGDPMLNKDGMGPRGQRRNKGKRKGRMPKNKRGWRKMDSKTGPGRSGRGQDRRSL